MLFLVTVPTFLAVDGPALRETLPYLQFITGLLAILVAVVTLGPPLRARYRNTIGRRRDHRQRLARLVAGAQLSFFETALGQPPTLRRTVEGKDYEMDREGEVVEASKSFTECIFVDRDYFVQTVSDQDDTVIGFSITTRHKRFNPVFTGVSDIDLFKVKLGKTPFSEIEQDPIYLTAFAGPRDVSYYSEAHGFGHAGFQQTFVFTASTAAEPKPGEPIVQMAAEIGFDFHPHESEPPDSRTLEHLAGWQEFRKQSAVTTYSVLKVPPELFPAETYGPHGDEVWMLPDAS